MSICDSEENRKKLAWLVPGYILLAWFFCVLFQPLGVQSPRKNTERMDTRDKNYRVIYLSTSSDHHSVCKDNGTIITLERGSQSGVIIRLDRQFYQYQPFNCSLQIKSGQSLDGVTAVVEEMDLREHEDDVRQPGGHWGSSVCIDYVEAFTDQSKVQNKLCGKWNILSDERLTSHGPKQTLVGYCYDDRSGHSCESKTIFLNTVIDSSRELSSRYGLNLRHRKGFSIVVTGYRHPEKASMDPCMEDEFSCPIHDFSVHDQNPHCIWDKFRCDSHQNCGFTINKDESGCQPSGLINPWSISTMTLLIIIYLAIVLILVLVTMLLLRWHKSLRAPMDVLGESRNATLGASVLNGGDISTASMITSGLPDGSTTTEARTGTVSIIVSYRPQCKPKSVEAPPSYESLFTSEHPPNYSAVAEGDENEIVQLEEEEDSVLRQVHELPDIPPLPSAEEESPDECLEADRDSLVCNDIIVQERSSSLSGTVDIDNS